MRGPTWLAAALALCLSSAPACRRAAPAVAPSAGGASAGGGASAAGPPRGEVAAGTPVAGIGIRPMPHEKGFAIGQVFPRGAAAEAGLAVGDVVLEVDDQSTSRWSLQRVAEKLRGVEGTSVRLLVERDGRSSVHTLTRRRLEDPGPPPLPKPGSVGAPYESIGGTEARRNLIALMLSQIEEKLGPGFPADRRERAAAIEDQFYKAQGAIQDDLHANRIGQAEANRLGRQNAITKARAYEALLTDEQYLKLFDYPKGSVR